MFSLLNSFVPKVFSLLNIYNYKVYYTFEVGGSAKDGRQTAEVSNAWIAADDIEHAIGNKLPLWLFGFLY